MVCPSIKPPSNDGIVLRWPSGGQFRLDIEGLGWQGPRPTEDFASPWIFLKFPPTGMTITPQAIPAVLLIEPKRFGDARGFFSETFREDALAKAGFTARFVQDNHSLSAQVGTLRGLHYQRAPHAQDKLVRVVRGAILDVAVDIRAGSPSFGKSVAAKLSAEDGHQLLVPKGFAHGFVTLEPDTEVLYKVTNFYSSAHDFGLAWDDPELGIEWGIKPDAALLSDKDRKWPRLRDLDETFS